MARTRLSMTSCRTSRSRDAPSARRTATSRRRREARTRKRFAALTQAITSTRRGMDTMMATICPALVLSLSLDRLDTSAIDRRRQVVRGRADPPGNDGELGLDAVDADTVPHSAHVSNQRARRAYR